LFMLVVIPTVPRFRKERHLFDTINGLLEQWPDDDTNFLYNRLSIRVYGTTDHPVFDEARTHFSSTKKGLHYIQWFQTLDPTVPASFPADSHQSEKENVGKSDTDTLERSTRATTLSHSKDAFSTGEVLESVTTETIEPAPVVSIQELETYKLVDASIPSEAVDMELSRAKLGVSEIKNDTIRNQQMIAHRIAMFDGVLPTNASYVMLLEDDFLLCQDGWNNILLSLDMAQGEVPRHCGVFVATGGSGLIFRNSALEVVYASLTQAREEISNRPSDVIMQDCLLGKIQICHQCSSTLVVSSSMLFGHIGHNSSTVENHYLPKDWQCGWRQVFNGYPDVFVVS